MKPIKNNKGYALLITLAILILFTALGLTILALASSGTKKNVIRQETIQATALSEKGIDQITTQINSELTKELGENGLPRGLFVTKLESILIKYKCPPNVQQNISNMEKTLSNTGEFGACILDFDDSIDENGQINDLRKLVKFASIGHTGKAERYLTSDVEIGAETVPETLKYAVGTNILSKNPKDGEGNLLMHGGVEIVGDIKVDGNILTRNEGYAYLGGGERWINSLYPSAKPTPGSKSSKLVLGKSPYTLDANKSYSTHIKTLNFPSSNGYTKHTRIQNLFRTGFSPLVVKREPTRSPIGISDKEAVYRYSKEDSGVETLTLDSSRRIQNRNMPNKKIFPTYAQERKECVEWGWNWWQGRYCTQYRSYYDYYDRGTYYVEGTNTFKQMSILGDIVIPDDNTQLTTKEGMYIDGNLKVGKLSTTSYDSKTYADITLDGPIFVNGNVTIRGANLKSNVLMYVTGTVDIQYSTMNGKELSNDRTGSFIIFAKGNIKISNNSVNKEEPSKIKGFFYSEEDLEMFGVGSNIRIEGGVSARRIVLNAIRGKASDTRFAGAQSIGGSYFDSVANQENKDSRLQIIYDPEIVTTFSDLRQQEPIIYKVDPPMEKDREIFNP